MVTDPPEDKWYLWGLTAAPALWAVHFLLSYGTASVWCAKYAGHSGSLGWVRAAIAAYTLAALVAVGVIGWRGWQRHRFGGSTLPHDFDSPADRHRFLGFATLLLSALSAVAIVYAALAAYFIGTCR